MTVDTSGIQKGMDVYDVNGEKVGSVDAVFGAASAQDTDAAAADPGGTTTIEGDAPAAKEGSYLKVERGGILGLGAQDLYIPGNAIQNVVPGDNVMINCTRDEAQVRYGARPEFLDEG